MTDEKKPFTVTDRRLFTSDGERRETSEAEVAEREAPAPPAAPAKQAPRPVGRSPLEGRGPSVPGVPGVDFASFLLGLGAQAGMLLGREGEPADLAGARELIAILEMLRDKTEGRRTAEEDEVLEGILYELRMAYLHKAGGAGA
jgi:hypothetical protein